MMRIMVLALTARVFLGALILSSASLAAQAAPLTTTVKAITQAGARTALKAAEETAEALKAPCSIAIVNASGILVAFESLDGVRAGSPDLAIGKARAAALLQRPTSEIEDSTDHGRTALVTAGFLTLRGGVPLHAGNEVIGAIGVAGLNKDNDVKIATAAAEKFSSAVANEAGQ